MTHVLSYRYVPSMSSSYNEQYWHQRARVYAICNGDIRSISPMMLNTQCYFPSSVLEIMPVTNYAQTPKPDHRFTNLHTNRPFSA